MLKLNKDTPRRKYSESIKTLKKESSSPEENTVNVYGKCFQFNTSMHIGLDFSYSIEPI